MKENYKNREIFLTEKYVLKTYNREKIVFVKAKGSYLWDAKGNKYLDFFPGWGIGNIGHMHKQVVKAVKEQASLMFHMPNNFYSAYQGELAKRLIELSFPGRVFFSNSGAEANECAFKLSRAYGNAMGKKKILSARKSFHGRTMATLTLTGQKKYQKGFKPLVSNVGYFDFNSIESFKKAFDKNVAAVFLEVVQGEGGVNVADKKFLRYVRKATKESGAILIFDEVQTGVGRTGEFFAFQNFGIRPDIITLAKALGGGVPIGATIISKRFCKYLQPGMHASTFGGNSLACRAALAVLDAFKKERILKTARKNSALLFDFLMGLKEKFSFIEEVKGIGMMAGVRMKDDYAYKVFKKALDNKLIVNYTAGCVLRIMPALNITEKDLKKGLKILEKICHECSK